MPVIVRVIAAAVLILCAGDALAQDRYTLIVSGATGDPKYAASDDRRRATLVSALRSLPEFRDDHLIVLAEIPGPGVGRASREGVRQAVGELQRLMTDTSELTVVLFGHGTYDGIDAKFNLVGPDLEAAEWEALLARLPGRLTFVNTTAASFPFVQKLAKPGRIIVAATDSAVQRYDTVFPEFFVQAFEDAAADTDKNGRVSIWEAFSYGSTRARRWYEQRGQLPTERPILDDTGDGRGREAIGSGPDGAVAARLYPGAGLEREVETTDPVLAPLVARRTDLETEVHDLKARKEDMDPQAYLAELERRLVDLARICRQIRLRAAGS